MPRPPKEWKPDPDPNEPQSAQQTAASKSRYMSVHLPDSDDTDAEPVVDLEPQAAAPPSSSFSKGRYVRPPDQEEIEKVMSSEDHPVSGSPVSESSTPHAQGWDKYDRRASGAGGTADGQTPTAPQPKNQLGNATSTDTEGEDIKVDLTAAAATAALRQTTDYYKKRLERILHPERVSDPAPAAPEVQAEAAPATPPAVQPRRKAARPAIPQEPPRKQRIPDKKPETPSEYDRQAEEAEAAERAAARASSFYERQLKKAVETSREQDEVDPPQGPLTYYRRHSAQLPRLNKDGEVGDGAGAEPLPRKEEGRPRRRWRKRWTK